MHTWSFLVVKTCVQCLTWLWPSGCKRLFALEKAPCWACLFSFIHSVLGAYFKGRGLTLSLTLPFQDSS
jgi:hypothetical protein